MSRVVSQGFSGRLLSACLAFIARAALCSAFMADQHAHMADMEMSESSCTVAHFQSQQAQDDSIVLMQGRRVKVTRVDGSDAEVDQAAEPETTEPNAAGPKASEAKASAREVVELKATESKAAELEAAEAKVAEPEVAMPNFAEPEVAEPLKAATEEPSDKLGFEFDLEMLASVVEKVLAESWTDLLHRIDHVGNSTRNRTQVSRTHGHSLLSLGVSHSSTHRRAGALLVFMLVLCTIIAVCPFMVLSLLDKRNRARRNSPGSSQNQSHPVPSNSMMSRSGPSPPGSQVIAGTSPEQQAFMFGGSSPQHTGQTATSPKVQFKGFPDSADSRLARPMPPSMPPQLCPSLVLPWCQARFGVPMRQLNSITSEGEVNIVGMSGNPLLRAAVRTVGESRMLEISIPQSGCTPRATIGPSDLFQGRLVICGPNGAFYAELDLRSNGALYLSRNGERLMVLDGSQDTLDITVKSGSGALLASAGYSSEPFGGVEHVEIRVEPGVDTVLILGCVLACFLFTPGGQR